MVKLDRDYFVRKGREGGKKGSKKLTPAERKERARQAGIASGKARRNKKVAAR